MRCAELPLCLLSLGALLQRGMGLNATLAATFGNRTGDYVVSLTMAGGLGNQLFQLFAILSYGIAHPRATVILPYTGDHIYERPSYWHSFFKSIAPLTTIDAPIGPVLANEVLGNFSSYSDPSCCRYSPLPEPSDQNLVLHGFFQSFRYFQNYSEEILEKLNTRKFQREVRVEFDRYFASSNGPSSPPPITVSLHFRLGDYKTKTQYHPLQKNHYYHHALQSLMAETRAVNRTLRVLYFCETEDVHVVVERVKALSLDFPAPGVEFVRVDDTIPDWKQMLLMSLCDDNIIANSTFSWWSAFLNLSPAKRVFYPATWFGEHGPRVQLADFFPASWVRLD